MGAVYLAEHRVMGHQVAIKVLPKQRAGSSSGMLERFINEARTAAQLHHPNVVRAMDISSDEGQAFIVMEYVKGLDLHKYVGREGPLKINQAIRICGQAAAGLQHAHERGIIHRDIKPSNLLISDDGVVKILDMGLAHWKKDADDEAPLTVAQEGSVLGTVDYLSPEQALHSRDVDARSDLYSLGCTLHFMLTGRPPFQGQNMVQRLTMHQTLPAPSLCDARPDCPAVLNEVFQRLMAKKPADRFQSGAELVLKLKEIKDDQLGSKAGKANRKARNPSAPLSSVSGSPRKSNASERDTKVPPAAVTSTGTSTLPSSDDLFSRLPTSPVLPPAYLTPTYATMGATPARPAANSKPAAKKSAASTDRTNLIVVIVFAAVVAFASLGSMFLFLNKSESKTSLPSMIQQREGESDKTVIIVTQ